MKKNTLCHQGATAAPSPSRGAVEQVIDSSKNPSSTWEEALIRLRNVTRWDSVLEDSKDEESDTE